MTYAKMLFKAVDVLFKNAQNPPKMKKQLADVPVSRDFSYCPQHPQLTLDLYNLPTDGNSKPVVFHIHGGGFCAGDKRFRDCLCRYVAKNTGAVVANVNYGMGKNHLCPHPIRQLVQAENWVAENAQKFNLDLSHFVAMGDSAGAYYASLLCAIQDSPQLQQLFHCTPTAKFTAAVLDCGLYDIPKMLEKNTAVTRGVCKEFFGVPLRQVHQSPYYKGLTVTDFVTENYPHTFLIHSTNDIFCKGQAEVLMDRFRQHNVPFVEVRAENYNDNHTYPLTWKSDMAQQTNAQMLEFLKNHFAE